MYQRKTPGILCTHKKNCLCLILIIYRDISDELGLPHKEKFIGVGKGAQYVAVNLY